MNFENPELLDKILENPQQAMRLAMILRHKNQEVPENVLNSLVSDNMMGANFARTLAQDYILTDEDVPLQLLKRISESPKDAFYLAKYYKKNNQRIPEIIFQTVKQSQYYGQSLDEDEETSSSFQQDFLKKILKNEDLTLRYTAALLKNNQPVPDYVHNAIIAFNDARTSRHFSHYLITHDINVPDKILVNVAMDNEESFQLAENLFKNLGKIAPDVILYSLATNPEYASNYGILLLNKKYINQRILKILEDGIARKSTSEHNEHSNEQAGLYAVVYTRILADLPSPKIMKLVTPKYLTYVAMNLLSHKKEVPQEILDKIASNPPRSFAFISQYKLAYGAKKLPPNYNKIKLAAKKYEYDTI